MSRMLTVMIKELPMPKVNKQITTVYVANIYTKQRNWLHRSLPSTSVYDLLLLFRSRPHDDWHSNKSLQTIPDKQSRFDLIIHSILFILLPSVHWRCWLGDRKGIRPVKKLSAGVLAWLSVWSEVQTCIWPSWCHCHSLSLASVKSRLVLPFWYRLTRVVLDKGPLNSCVYSFYKKRTGDWAVMFTPVLWHFQLGDRNGNNYSLPLTHFISNRNELCQP